MQSLKVLISAYACRPGVGSEPGIGWDLAQELVKYHQIWVITRENNRPSIEAEIGSCLPGLHFVYCDLPRWARWWYQGQRGVQFHYYLWQVLAYFVARRLHREVEIDLVHHVTYVKYWGPSFLSLLPIPFIWGPVGGGESAPKAFWQGFGLRGRIYETLRNFARWLGECDPFVRLTAQRAVLARATTEDTAQRLRRMGASHVQVLSQLGLSKGEFLQMAQHPLRASAPVRFVSIGRLLHWKGFHLGLHAFAHACLPDDAEYWILGDGPQWERLQSLAKELNIAHQVKFWGMLSREETLHKLGECLALIHPSLHESGGMVCLEAMAAGRPVVCLDLGGPAIQVVQETGFKVPAHTPEQAVHGLATAMTRLVTDAELRVCMGQAGQKRVSEVFSWEVKGQALAQLYEEILEKQQISSSEYQISNEVLSDS